MKITILGFGNVGAQLGKLWAAKGHTITAGVREAGKGADKAKQLGIAVATPAIAVEHADVIALALPWPAVPTALASLGSLVGKVILDATNPMAQDLSVVTPEAGSGGEQIAHWAESARVIKAFNTIGATSFGDQSFNMFYCGDDAAAKETVRSLIEDTRMPPVDVGPLKNARYLEQIAGLWVDLAVKQQLPGAFGFNLIRKQ